MEPCMHLCELCHCDAFVDRFNNDGHNDDDSYQDRIGERVYCKLSGGVGR